jgi:hypothetical protein
MAVRRMNRRRNAGAPTSGALLINPRKRRRKAKSSSRKRKTTTRRKNTAAKRSTAAKKAAATRRRNAMARSRAAKKAAATRRRNAISTTRKRTVNRRRNGTHKGMKRKTARRAYMKTNRRRNPVRRRRNTAALAGIQQSVKKVPVVGGMLADVVGLGIPAAFGAISILPIEMGLKAGGRFLPPMLQKVSFTVGGLVMGALAKRFLPATAATRDKIAVALATAGGAVDFYRMRTGQGTVAGMEAAETAGFGAELGELEIMDGFGELEIMDGFGELEIMDGFGELEIMDGYGGAHDMGDMEYDVVNFPEAGGWAGEASLMDAEFAGHDMTSDEVFAALSGPRRFDRKFRAKAQAVRARRARGGRRRSPASPSAMAGKPGVRWGWVIKLVGPKPFKEIAALPAEKRRSVIKQLKDTARAQVSTLIEAESAGGASAASDSTDGFGAYLYAV